MNILDKINSPEDLKGLDSVQLETLASELREYMIKTVAQNGGHLASNLGVVELSVALERVYDTAEDRLVFDVGHQCYVHKILTGRREEFSTLRTHGGISGFPKPEESVTDAAVAGHASNSVSVALGMARARTLTKGAYKVVAVIGDGALTGGLAYEGLCDAGASGESMVVILNDNGMSINSNVGSMSNALSRLRVKAGYFKFKRAYRKALGSVPALYRFNHAVKEHIKRKLLPNNIFSDLGFHYLGPVAGHNFTQLESVLNWAKDLDGPVLVHVKTVKGKGYPFAEKDPEAYHGVGCFNAASGLEEDTAGGFSRCMGETLCNIARENDSVAAVTAAMSDGTGLTEFAHSFPDRFFDVGIAEEHAVAMASGMARQGITPVFAVYSSFLQRGYDMLIHDVALSDLHVVLAVDRAGIVGQDGETHQGVFDVDFLGGVPGITVLCPSSYAELSSMLAAAVNDMSGAVAVRYPKGCEGEYKDDSSADAVAILREGKDISIAAYGIMINNALDAAALLEKSGVSAEVIKLNSIYPLEGGAVLDSISKTRRFIMLEDVCAAGCVGERILALCAERGVPLCASALLNVGVGIVPHGETAQLQGQFGLDAQSVAARALELIGNSGAQR